MYTEEELNEARIAVEQDLMWGREAMDERMEKAHRENLFDEMVQTEENADQLRKEFSKSLGAKLIKLITGQDLVERLREKGGL